MQSELTALGTQINERRRAHDSVVSQQLEFPGAADADNRRAHVVGRISPYLESLPSAASTDFSQLARNLATSAERVAALELWFEDLDLEGRLASAINLIGRSMSGYANQLEMEWRDRPLRLDLKKLTVTADHPSDPVTLE